MSLGKSHVGILPDPLFYPEECLTPSKIRLGTFFLPKPVSLRCSCILTFLVTFVSESLYVSVTESPVTGGRNDDTSEVKGRLDGGSTWKGEVKRGDLKYKDI